MTAQMLSYLVRYLFVFLLVVFVWLLVREALVSLRKIMKMRVQPVSGTFLFLEPEAGSGLSFSLYHMTSIGRSPSNDIRIKADGIAKRHALIYLYDGIWFIRPLSHRAPVLIDSVRVHSPTPLIDQDQVTLGTRNMTFVANRASTFDASFEAASDLNWSEADLRGHDRTRHLSTLAFNLVVLTGGLILLFLLPDPMESARQFLLGSLMVFWMVSNLYLILIPRLLKGADRNLLLVFFMLAFLGLMIQTRLMIPEAMINREILTLNGIFSRLVHDFRGLLIQLSGKTALPAIEPGSEMAQAGIAILARLQTQVISLAAGLLLLIPMAVLVARTRLPELLVVLCAILTPGLLLATLLLGNGADAHGATLRIELGGMSLQLTEFVKITYLVVVAGFFKNRPSTRLQLVFAGWAGLVFFLIMMLPDLGSAMILLPTTLLVYVVMTSEYWTTLLILATGTGLGTLAYAIFPHVQRRIMGWTTLWTEVNDSNRQIVYGLQAMVRGGLFGRGLANGSPGGIPLASSDMVFALMVEEMGLITGLLIVLIFIIIWLRTTRLTVLAPDGFRSSLALAFGTMLFIEAFVVIAGSTGLIPLTGATLPLIARGGSSLLAKLLILGILVGLSAKPRGTVRSSMREEIST